MDVRQGRHTQKGFGADWPADKMWKSEQCLRNDLRPRRSFHHLWCHCPQYKMTLTHLIPTCSQANSLHTLSQSCTRTIFNLLCTFERFSYNRYLPISNHIRQWYITYLASSESPPSPWHKLLAWYLSTIFVLTLRSKKYFENWNCDLKVGFRYQEAAEVGAK